MYIKSNCRPKASLGPTGLGLPPRSHAECLVPSSQTIRSALALNLCCIRYHWRSYPFTWNYSRHLCPRKQSHTHTHRQQHQTHSLGEIRWEAQLSPHTHSLFFSPLLCRSCRVSLLPAIPEPLPPSFGPLLMTWEFKKCLVIHLDANASYIFYFIHSANIY